MPLVPHNNRIKMITARDACVVSETEGEKTINVKKKQKQNKTKNKK